MSSSFQNLNGKFLVQSDKCTYLKDSIISDYTYESTMVLKGNIVKPIETKMQFKTETKVPKTGVMLIGLGGNNGCTCVAGAIANKLGLEWETKEGIQKPNYWGSLLLSSTVKLGYDASTYTTHTGNPVYTPMNNMLPMLHPNDIIWGGWDINNMNLGDAMKRSKVLDIDLQRKLYSHMVHIVPLKSVYFSDFIAANQSDRVNNILTGSKYEQMEHIRKDIRTFKTKHSLDNVIIVWTANTERFASIEEGINDTADHLLDSIRRDESEISASTIYATASILEKCTFLNGSPQNTFVPGVIDLAMKHQCFLGGDDFKSGQTKLKSVLVDFLVSAGIKPVSIVSYNHLGNNDGKNLSAPSQFRSKEISKSNVVDDMVSSNHILYNDDNDNGPDHCVVIKYVPYVADSKRAMDEYTSEIFMGGKNTIVMHNTCEDSLLATPLIYDLVILAELCQRITIRQRNNNNNDNKQQQTTTTTTTTTTEENGETAASTTTTKTAATTATDVDTSSSSSSSWESFHPVLSLLSYMLKAPLVPKGSPVINALFAQRNAIVNVLRACLGLAPENHMMLEHRLESMPFLGTNHYEKKEDNNNKKEEEEDNDNVVGHVQKKKRLN